MGKRWNKILSDVIENFAVATALPRVAPFEKSQKRDFCVTDIYLVIKHLVCGKNIFELRIFCIVLMVVVIAKVLTKIAKYQFHGN